MSGYGLERVTRDWVPKWLWHLFCWQNLGTWEPFKHVLTRRATQADFDRVEQDTERPDGEPREWLVEASEKARNPHDSNWRVLGEPRLASSERIHVVEVVRDTEQEHER